MASERAPLLKPSTTKLKYYGAKAKAAPAARGLALPRVSVRGLFVAVALGSLFLMLGANPHEARRDAEARADPAVAAPGVGDAASDSTTTATMLKAVRPREREHHHAASATVRSRSAFTCALCVAAALVILLPRLACGADDVRGNSVGPGVAEALVSSEARAGLALFLPWLAVSVPLSVVDRELVRGNFPFPLSLSAMQLAASAALGAVGAHRDGRLSDWLRRASLREYALRYAPLGVLAGASAAIMQEATRARACGPRLAMAFASVQGVVVLFLGVALRRAKLLDYDEWGAASPAEAAEAEAGDGGDAGPGDAGPAPAPASDRDDDSVGSYDDCGCCCPDEHVLPAGGAASLFALLVAFGGAGIMALGEAEVGETSRLWVGLLCLAQVLAAGYVLGFERRFRLDRRPRDDRPPLDHFGGLLLTAPVAVAVVAAAAVGLELAPAWSRGRESFGQLDARSSIAGRWGVWLLGLDVGLFAVAAALALAVIDRFSALVAVLFVAARSVLVMFACALLFGDVVTSLEYKGAMVLVLGLVIWALEASKAMLDPASPLGAAARKLLAEEQLREDERSGFRRPGQLAPSNFLEGEAAERAAAERATGFRRRAAPAPRRDDDDDDDGGDAEEGASRRAADLDDMTRARIERAGLRVAEEPSWANEPSQ